MRERSIAGVNEVTSSTRRRRSSRASCTISETCPAHQRRTIANQHVQTRSETHNRSTRRPQQCARMYVSCTHTKHRPPPPPPPPSLAASTAIKAITTNTTGTNVQLWLAPRAACGCTCRAQTPLCKPPRSDVGETVMRQWTFRPQFRPRSGDGCDCCCCCCRRSWCARRDQSAQMACLETPCLHRRSRRLRRE